MSITPTITEPNDFPALYQSTNQRSLESQASFIFWLRLRLVGFVFAAVGGAAGWKTGSFHTGGAIAFIAFAVSLMAELVLAIQRPDRTWYEGRAAAESAKTLSWRFMMCAEGFEADVPNVERRFVEEIEEILHDLDALSAPTDSGSHHQITDVMREVRSLSFEEHRKIYLEERIQNQQEWYGRKAVWNETRAKQWIVASVIFEFLGLAAAAAEVGGWIETDLLGIFATAAAAATAWLQAKQHQTLATAYSVTSQELASVASEVAALTDVTVWAHFVAEAEEAISREHTLWRASRGVRIRPRRAPRGGS